MWRGLRAATQEGYLFQLKHPAKDSKEPMYRVGDLEMLQTKIQAQAQLEANILAAAAAVATKSPTTAPAATPASTPNPVVPTASISKSEGGESMMSIFTLQSQSSSMEVDVKPVIQEKVKVETL